MLHQCWHLFRDEEGDLSTYLAQGILAIAALSIAGVVLYAFNAVGTHLKDIVQTWLSIPVNTGL